jgi:hypothetical protein
METCTRIFKAAIGAKRKKLSGCAEINTPLGTIINYLIIIAPAHLKKFHETALLRWGNDQSLSRPGRKQSIATKLGNYSNIPNEAE